MSYLLLTGVMCYIATTNTQCQIFIYTTKQLITGLMNKADGLDIQSILIFHHEVSTNGH